MYKIYICHLLIKTELARAFKKRRDCYNSNAKKLLCDKYCPLINFSFCDRVLKKNAGVVELTTILKKWGKNLINHRF